MEEEGGLTDVVTGGVTRLEDKLVCCLKLATNVVTVEFGSSCMALTDQYSWKGIWWDWQLAGLGSIPCGKVVYIHMVRNGTAGFSNVRSITYSTQKFVD